MNPLVALDFATKHRIVRNQIIASNDLAELAFELIRLFGYAARQLHTDLGWLATTLALTDIANATDEPWPARHAADLILSCNMIADLPDAESALQDLGAFAAHQRWNIIEVTCDVAAVLAAIPETWFRLVPALDVPLLEYFATELDEDGL